MARKNQAAANGEVNDQVDEEQAVEEAILPETTPESIAAGLMEELGDEPLIPRKPGRPKKQKSEDDEVLPPEHLREDEESDEADDNEPLTDATEGDEDQDAPDVREEIEAVGERYGVDPSLLDDCETVEEAKRFINRLFKVYQHEGANGHSDGYAPPARQEQSEPAPKQEAAPVTELATDLDLEDYDEEDKTPKNFKVLRGILEETRKEIKSLKEERDKARQAESQRFWQRAAKEIQDELSRISPELFGTEKKQDRAQQKRIEEVFDVANLMLDGAMRRPNGTLPPMRALAEMAANSKFAKELANKQLLAKRASISERAKRKQVSAPARVSRGNPSAMSAGEPDGDLRDDKDLLAAVNGVLVRNR